MSRNWRNPKADDGEAGSDGEGEGEGGGASKTELMDWEQIAHSSTKDIVLFCIDAGPHMHKINPDTNVSFLHSALLAACKFQETKLIASPNDQVGILLFGTQYTEMQGFINKGPVYSHCTVLQKIAQVDVEPLVDIFDLLADDERGTQHLDRISLTAPYEKGKLFRIEHALGNAVHYMIAQGKTGYKRIFFMTNNDDPAVLKNDDTAKPIRSSSERTDATRKCLKFVNEAGLRNIELEPLFISSSEHTFEVDKFYGNVFAAYDDPLSSDPEVSSDSDDSETEDDEDEYDLLADLLPNERQPSSALKTKAQRRAERIARQSKREQREARNRSLYDCAVKMEEISQTLEERQMPKRVVFNTVMEIGEGIQLGVKGYSMFAKATRGTPVRMVEEASGYREVAAKVVPVCEDTGQILQPKKDIDTAFSFGAGAAAAGYNEAMLADQERQAGAGAGAGPSTAREAEANGDLGGLPDLGSIPGSAGRGLAKFTKEEMREMREMGLPHGIRILGFKPQSKLEFWMNTKHSVFLYPTDETYAGSKRFFASLLQSMAKKKVFGLAVCLPRAGSTPSFAAIWPREEEVSAEGVQLTAPGMFMIPLPYADDIRDNPVEMSLTPKREEVEAAAAIVKKYSYSRPFYPDTYNNPALALHYATLRAAAFDRERPMTSKIAQARQAAAAASAAGEQDGMEIDGGGGAAAVPSSSMGTLGTMLSSVRKAEVVKDDTLPEYENIDATEEEVHLIRNFNELILKAGYGSVRGAPPKFKKRDEATLKSKWASQTLSTYKVDELKAALLFYKLALTGRKAELVERLDTFLTLRWG
ncbi:unnamed protein product [Tilletia laevis]|uniref:DNA helicase n=2 Tax=Tilletia TaxID=13289 RepID=A0A177UYV6_9BASI|nr:hypothetical protein CF336_g3774 [Tilletia laevis]KAE8261566.1 hypothetical protein A4X03_0g3145 [Tilletia caries]CAD6907082.1 unnamed protein product [Tilletia controversa]KAE8203761.1 hypothetical protein CF335_g2900 [Tilletia laevis]CAD6888224.1 unnamed protein product [Tilletia caries]